MISPFKIMTMARTKQDGQEKAFTAILSKRIEGVVISLTLDTRKRDEKLAVAVRINHNRRTIYHRTGLKCTLDEWADLCKASGRGASKGGKLYIVKVSQEKIFEKVEKAVQTLIDSDSFTLENLKTKLTGRTDDTFTALWLSIIEKRRKDGQVGTADSYMNSYNSFVKFAGKNVLFDRICSNLVDEWSDKMKADELSATTISIYQRSMRVACNEALRLGQIKYIQYPFGKQSDKVTIKKGRSRKDDFLSIPEILKLRSFVAPKGWKKGYIAVVHEAVDMFLFSYLGNGLNTADIALLEWNNHYFASGETELRFIRKKTEDTAIEQIEINIPIIEPLRDILNRYATKPELGVKLFPNILGDITDPEKIKAITKQTNSNYGDRLKNACKIVGITKAVSMTFARHSFATNLTHKGVQERYISQAMGHSTKNITGGYIGGFSPSDRIRFNSMLLEI